MQTDLKRLQDIFIEMAEDGFDTKGELKWNFYFVNADVRNLDHLFNELIEYGYVIEGKNKKDDEWTLKLSKIEHLTPERLYKRNIAFNELANYCNVDLYDGWDVEKLSTQ